MMFPSFKLRVIMRATYPLLLLVMLTMPPVLAGQDNLLDFPDRWEVSGGEIVAEAGEPTLRITGGQAVLQDLEFSDGTVTFEMRLTSRPAFVGFHIRAREQDTEHIYFRPHKSGQWDAIQYQPIMNGSSQWQTHTGPGFSQAVALPAGEWIQVRLMASGDVAELYVGRAEVPTMRLKLQRGVTSGAIVLGGGFRGSPPAGEVAIAFRRVSVTSGSPEVGPAPEEAGGEQGFLRRWSVSDPFTVSETPVTEVPAVAGGRTEVEAEPRGLVNLNRYFSRIEGDDLSAVLAEVVLQSDRAIRVPLDFNYSDNLSLFLNGELIYSGNNSWQSRHPFYLGVISPDNLVSTAWLPLVPGPNRLSLVVSERAFGWGFYARLSDAPAVEVRLP